VINHQVDERHHVVIIGSGFGGLFAAKALRRVPVRVTLIDRTNHHLFQPLLYQVATGILSEGQIAPAIRDIFRNYNSMRIVLGEVEHIDPAARQLAVTELDHPVTISYDSLIVAGGAVTSYFGHDDFRRRASGMKSLDDALYLRGQIFGAFEEAEAETDEERRRALMTFVVVGGGPTGVEMAGTIADLAKDTLPRDFRHIDTRKARVVLIEAGPRVLAGFPDDLSAYAQKSLEQLGIDVMRKIVSRVAGMNDDIRLGNGAAGGFSQRPDDVIFEVLRLFHFFLHLRFRSFCRQPRWKVCSLPREAPPSHLPGPRDRQSAREMEQKAPRSLRHADSEPEMQCW